MQQLVGWLVPPFLPHLNLPTYHLRHLIYFTHHPHTLLHIHLVISYNIYTHFSLSTSFTFYIFPLALPTISTLVSITFLPSHLKIYTLNSWGGNTHTHPHFSSSHYGFFFPHLLFLTTFKTTPTSFPITPFIIVHSKLPLELIIFTNYYT